MLSNHETIIAFNIEFWLSFWSQLKCFWKIHKNFIGFHSSLTPIPIVTEKHIFKNPDIIE